MKLLTHIGLILLLLCNVATAEEFSIGIKEAKPLAYQENGQWKGISVDLIQELSKEMNFTYKFVSVNNITSLIDASSNGAVDMSIAAISLTPEREEVIDFSHKYFTTSIGILSNVNDSWIDTILWVISRVALILIGFIISLYVVGYIIDKVDGNANIKSPHDGAWWALVTFTTTGYGDVVPKTSAGKVLASIWMIASLFLLSAFTGYVASVLTVKNLTDTPMTLSTLYNANVVAVNGSTGQQRLNALGIKHITVPDLEMGLELFKSGKVNAVVHDDTMLNYAAKSMDNVLVSSIANSEEDYAITLPPNSKLTRRVNLGILRVLASPTWKAIRSQYNVLQ